VDRYHTHRVSTTDPFADDVVVDRLRALHEHYIDAVNRAIADDRYDLVADLVVDYPDEALAMLAPCRVSPPDRRTTGGRRRAVGCRCRAMRWVSAVRAAIW
jgi:hypothetical protein